MKSPKARAAMQVSLAIEPILDTAANLSSPKAYAERLDVIADALRQETALIEHIADEARWSVPASNNSPKRSNSNV